MAPSQDPKWDEATPLAIARLGRTQLSRCELQRRMAESPLAVDARNHGGDMEPAPRMACMLGQLLCSGSTGSCTSERSKRDLARCRPSWNFILHELVARWFAQTHETVASCQRAVCSAR